MDIDYYWLLVKGKKVTACVVTLTGSDEIIQGVYTGEKAAADDILMCIRPTGETKKRYANIGISDPNPDLINGDTLEVTDLGLPVRKIQSIEFKESAK